jgi:hypothetical protein
MSKQEIKKIRVQSYKGVREIVVEPEGRSLVVIAGANGAGKSSFIDAVSELFAPGGIRKTPAPRLKGEEEALVEVETDIARVVRRWRKDDAGQLDAYALEGSKFPSGTKFVLEATGGALFDPAAFMRMDAKDQRDELLSRIELPFDLAKLEADRKAAFDGRTEVSREVKRLRAVKQSLPAVDEALVEKPSADIVEQLEQAHQIDRQRHTLEDDEWRTAAHVAELADTIAKAEATLAKLRTDHAAAKTSLEDAKKKLSAAPSPIDTEDLKQQLRDVEDHNRSAHTNANVRAKHEDVNRDLTEKETTETTLTKKITNYDTKKVTALAEAKLPDPLLSIEGDELTYDGVPFRQVNKAKQVLVAAYVVMMGKPDLRLMVVEDGEALDNDSLAELEKLALEHGYLVLAARDRDRPVSAHVLVDGVIAAVS